MSRALCGLQAAVTSLAVALAAPAPGRAAGAASPAAHDAGAWDLSFEKGNRRCRLFLRTETHGEGFALAMPAGCHKAFPSLADAAVWSPGGSEHVLFRSEAGAILFDFAPNGTAALAAVAGESDSYDLTPINPALQDVLRTAPTGSAASGTIAAAAPGGPGVLIDSGRGKGKSVPQKAAAPAPVLPPTTVPAVAGNYAVLRQARDTGCMVTLDTTGHAKSELRAKLAPACRDQGIVIFDPVGWQLLHGNELVLTAKRGHTTALTRRDEKTWANAPPRGAALVLKRL